MKINPSNHANNKSPINTNQARTQVSNTLTIDQNHKETLSNH